MKLPKLRTLLLAPLLLFALTWLGLAIHVASLGDDLPASAESLSPPKTIAILGASGTAGDGILETALADPGVETIRVITRRMQAGIEQGKVEATLHMDYLDYSAVRGKLADVDAVFWAPTSSLTSGSA